MAKRMRTTTVFTGAYSWARSTKLLEVSWFRRIFLSSDFLYKRWYEDPFGYLTRKVSCESPS